MRLRGDIKKPLVAHTSTDIIAVQIWGNDEPEVRGIGSFATKKASLMPGDVVRIAEEVTVVVPRGVTVDVLVIP